MAENIITIDNLVKRVNGREVLSINEFSVEDGETVAFYGPNGSGKSTLLRVLSLIDPFDEGKLLLFGKEAINSKSKLELRRKIALVFDQPIIYKTNVYENVAIGLKLRGTHKKEVRKKTEEMMALLKIAHLSDRPANQLSRGEGQRVCLARALALDPEIFLFDEPLNGLDAATGQHMSIELRQLMNEAGRTSIYVTHDLNEARKMADRLIFITDGRLKEEDENSQD